MAYTTPPDFTPFDVLTAAQMDILGNNDVFFYAYMGAGTNAIQQFVSTGYSAVATGTTTIPADDTIPQITEGDQYMTLTITPKSATNLLFIEAQAFLAHTATGTNLIAALFQDSTADSLAGAFEYFGPTGGAATIITVGHQMTAGTTNSTTFRIRCGSNTPGTTTFNGVSGNRFLGAITKSWIKVTEYKA